MPETKTYLGVKRVNALLLTLAAYNALRGWPMPEGEDGTKEGYLVEYIDSTDTPNHPDYAHYISWSPKGTFDDAYKPVEGLPFGHAIEALKLGKRVARTGWNGKGMYLWLLPAATVKAEWCREPHLKAVAEAQGGEIEALGSIRMMTADKKVLTGWLASQTDMLATDWMILD